MSRNNNLTGHTGNTDASGQSWKRNPSDIIKEALLNKDSSGSISKMVGKSAYADKREENNHQKIVKERIDQYKKDMVNEASSRKTVLLPGTDPDDNYELSDRAKEALEEMAIRREKKERRKEKMKEQFKPEDKKEKAKKGFMSWMGSNASQGKLDPAEQQRQMRMEENRRRDEDDRRRRRDDERARREEERRRRDDGGGGW